VQEVSKGKETNRAEGQKGEEWLTWGGRRLNLIEKKREETGTES